MSKDPVRDLLVQQRDRLAELSAAADELVRRYDALTDPALPFDIEDARGVLDNVQPLHPRPVA